MDLFFEEELFGQFVWGRLEVPVFCCSTKLGGVHLIMFVMSFALLVVLRDIFNDN